MPSLVVYANSVYPRNVDFYVPCVHPKRNLTFLAMRPQFVSFIRITHCPYFHVANKIPP